MGLGFFIEIVVKVRLPDKMYSIEQPKVMLISLNN